MFRMNGLARLSAVKKNLHVVRLIAASICVAALITLLLATANKRLGGTAPVEAQTQNPTTLTAPPALSTTAPPQNLEISQANSQTATSPGRQVFIGFDGLPYSPQVDPYYDTVLLTYALPSNQYPDAIFSSIPGYHVATYGRPYGTGLPSITRASDFYNYANHLVPLTVDFPKPVTDLTFYLTGVDYLGAIGAIDIYQNNVYTHTEPLFGYGSAFIPAFQNLSSNANVTRIVVKNITDPNGLGFDNFSFTVQPVPSPTPTPLPSPTPPSVPTNVIAIPDEEEIDVSWTPSQGAGWYIVKRDIETSSVNTSGAANVQTSAFAPIDPSFFCNTSPCVFSDLQLDPNLTYSYVIAAANASGTSNDSSPAKGKPLPKPGCNAYASATPTPPPGSVTGFGWFMNYTVSPQDGLILSDIYLNGKRMAREMSLPYFWITTSSSTHPNLVRTRGELKPTGTTSSSMRSRLVDYKIRPSDPDKILVEADYAIDNIPGAPRACLNISQKYEFYREGASPPDLTGPCEPSDSVHPCNKFRPMVEYSFHGGQGEFLSSLNTPLRLHFQNTVMTGNTVALTRDIDNRLEGLAHPLVPFRKAFNPLMQSWHSQVIVPRSPASPDKNANTVDNFHQTNDRRSVLLPGLKFIWFPTGPVPVLATSGCPECVHFHWRWASFFSGPNFRDGIPIVPPGSDQAVDIEVVPFRNVTENYHPFDYYQLFNPSDPLRNPQKGANEPYDVVFWYSPTGFATSDRFFWHTAWFTPQQVNAQTTVPVSPSAANATSNLTVQDGPVSVSFGSVYEEGNTTFAPYDLSTLPQLPAGYAALNNAAHLITTTATVGGPYQVDFSAASVTDQNDFNSLKIFEAEPDPFDPERPIWVDATIVSPDSPAPNFSNKTLSGRTDRLGVFVIGKLAQTVPPAAVANLRLSSSDSPDPVRAGNNLTYTVTVTNDGPQTATEVAFKNPISPDVDLISATTSQGTCKTIEATVYCSLNSLAAGSSATVTLVVQPTEGTADFPAAGKMIANVSLVRAKELDSDVSNNSVTEATNAQPSNNNPPIVSITSPLAGNMFAGPLNLTLTAVATDSDGTVGKVDFFDNEELIGSGVAGTGNTFTITKPNLAFGNHSLIAVATDNGGRKNISSTVDVIVNGSATVNMTSPASGTFAAKGSNINLGATATHPSGFLSKVEFFANGQLIGAGTLTSGTQYSFLWNNVNSGNYALTAVATDGSGITTTTLPVNLTVDTPPTVSITAPINGTAVASSTNISVSALAQSSGGSIARVDFLANGILIGSASDAGTDKFSITWRRPSDGFYSLTAVATDNLGVSTTSPAITIGVNTPSPQPGEFVWFDDALPAGAVKHAEGDANWFWVDANPVAFSGAKAHQSLNFGQLDAPNTSFHQHYFDGATATLPVNVGDRLFTYVFLDINNMPREIMLQWKDASGWAHRAYWGQNRINLGPEWMWYGGPLPKASTWVRLEVPASQVFLEGSTVTGMAFTLDGGRATWDLAGKLTANAPPAPTPSQNDFIWVDDAVPAGATQETLNDQWQWIAPHVCGSLGHRSYFTVNQGAGQMRSHSFRGASNTMSVLPGDVLFTYVFLDANNMPDQLMLQWHDGSSWEHRAFWGENFIASRYQSVGIQGTESQRYMGGLPPGNQWVRLEVPASYVGLEGKTVSGMSFGFYSTKDHAGINWDCSGKAGRSTTVPLLLTPTTGVWRLYSTNYGYSYNTNDQGEPDHVPQKKDAFFVYPNQAAGTVPMYRFKRPTNNEYFYSRCKECYDGHGWQYDGIAFYVFPDGTVPNTLPLYLYHDNHSKYFLTTDQNEAAGMTFDAIWAYVPDITPLAPAPPTFLVYQGCYLDWRDNSWNEAGFKIERLDMTYPNGVPTPIWNQIGTALANTPWFKIGCHPVSNYYRVRAYNSFGDSAYSNDTCINCYYLDADPGQRSPEVSITSPQNGEVVNRDFAIAANSFDLDGNGTIAKVEFFANDNKIGEVSNAPFVFVWNNAPAGFYNVVAKATDANGLITASGPVSVTIGAPVTITVNGFSGAYDGQAHGATGSATGVNGENLSSLLNLGSSFTDVPGGTSHWTFAGNASYAPASGDVAITITPRAANIAVNGFTGTYDGQAHGATGSATGVSGENLSNLLSLGASFANVPGGTAHWTFAGNSNYAPANGDATITINKATPAIIWNNPSDIGAGTSLGAAQLNATANVPGTFTYSPAAGTVLNVGNNQQLSVTFTPTDAASFNSVTASVRVNVVAGLLFTDDFNDNSLDPSKWSVIDPSSPAVVSEQGQELRITLAPGTAAYNGVYTNSTYDLRGRTVQVDMVQYVSQAGWAENYFEAVLDGQNYFYISAGAGSMVCAAVTNGLTDRVVTNFDPGARYVRIRHDQSANSINFETSADRIVWTLRKSVTAGFSLAALRFELVAGAWGTGNGAPGAARYDNIQLVGNETANMTGISNRGFELPALGAGGYQYGPTNAGWNFGGGGGITANGSGFTYGNPGAPEGNQVAFLQGGGGSTISQSISGFRSDVAYTITFAAAQRGNCCGAGGQDFQVYLDDFLLTTIRPSSTSYVDYSTPEFNTTAGTHVLKFAGLDSLGGDNSAFIDNVRITNSPLPTSANAAACVSQAVPTTMVAGRTYSVSVTMRNTGSNVWTTPTNYNLGSQNPQDNTIWGVGRVGLTGSVAPGSKVTFNFVVTAPATSGIYNFQWRMVQDYVEWFGEFAPTVAVNVVAAGAGTAYNSSQGASVPGILETELYDNGGEGVAYHDTTAGNFGADYDQANYPTPSFRMPTDVDLYKSTSGYSNGYLVLMQAGDWMNYTINVSQTGSYTLDAKTYDASAVGGIFHIESDGIDVTGPLQIPGDASNWRAVKKSGVWLTSGRHTLRVVADTNGSDAWYTGDVDYINFQLLAPQPVRWTSAAGVSISGNNLTKTDADGWGNAGAISTQSIGSGVGYVESTINETNKYRMIGLSNGDSTKSYDDIDFAIYPAADGGLYIYEAGAYRGYFGKYAIGDVLRVGVESGAIVYRRNGQLIFKSNIAPSYPLLVDTSLYSSGSTLMNAFIGCSASLPGTIEVELYDNGGEGAGYHDTTPGTYGADYDQPPNYPTPNYRLPTDVDVYKSTNYSNNYLIAMQAGDWMNYTINVPVTSMYAMQARVIWGGSGGTLGTFHVEIDGINKTGSLQLPDTNWGWTILTSPQLQLTAGQHVMRLVADTNAGNGFTGDFDYLSFVPDTGGPVGYWKFDENTGTIAADSSGNGNSGTLTAGAAWSLGHSGAAVTFDGSSGYIQIGARPSLALTSSATFAAWIYPTGSANGIIINKEGEYEIARFSDGTIQWAIANSNPGWAWINTGGVAPVNQWTHVAITYDGGVVKTYINGTLVQTYNGSGPIGDVDGNQNDFRVGGRQCCSQFFQGRIDEVKVYNRVLAPSEVMLLSSSNQAANGYSFQRAITIDHTKVPNTDQANFPLLIKGTYSYLATAANGGNVQNSNGYDVIFSSDSGCAGKLNHEVETYDASTGAANYWVKVPTVSHTTDTVIYMCYGNPSISTSQENAAGVWDANFKAIYHLKDGTSLNVTDATNNHGLTNNSATASTGQVDGGAAFDGSTQYLSIGEHPDFDWANLRTVEVWMKLGNTTQTLPRVFSHGDGSSDGWSVTWLDPASGAGSGWVGNFLVVSIGTQGTPAIERQTPDNGTINSAGMWHHVVVVGDGATVAAVYVDGSPVTLSNYLGNITNTTVSGLNIGRRNNNARYFNGSLDEIRLSNVQRSADWIRTEYNNQSSPTTFYTIQ